MQAADPIQRIGTFGQVAAQAVAIVRGAANWTILVNAASLVGTRIVTSGLGFVYWWLAARMFNAEAIGLAAAVISTMLLLGTIGMLGLNALLIVELPRHRGQQGSLITTALLMSGAVGAGLGLAFAVGSPFIVPSLSSLASDPLTAALFAMGVGLTAVTFVLDPALIGLLRGGVQLTRNAIFSASKLAALACLPLLLLNPSATSIWGTWVLGLILSLIGLMVIAAKAGVSHKRCYPDWTLLPRLRRNALMHYVLDLCLEVPTFAMPLVVTATLSAASNAYFYTAATIISLLAMVPQGLSTALYAVGAQAPENFPQRLRFTLALSVVLVAGANVVMFVIADPFLRIFGDAYANEAAWTLRILSLMVFTRIVLVNYDIISRLRGRMASAAVILGVSGALELGLAAVGAALYGLEGLAAGWAISALLQAFVMLPTVLRAAWPPEPDRREASANNSLPGSSGADLGTVRP